ncbi:MAG: MFS transporter, partial [Clostridia bacterium]|nr:MFS transporter [Clostridia bacterium]
MNQLISPKATKIAWMFSLLYFSSYVMRINFAVMLVKVISEMQVEKTALSVVITGLTITYGIGQVISGVLGDKIKPQYLLTAGLAVAALCNIAMFFCTTIPAMTVVWSINGLAHALLWPPMVRLMSTNLSDIEYSYAAVRISWGSSGATILLYLVCPLLLYIMNWRSIMLLCAAFGIAVLALWVAINRRLLQGDINTSAATQTDAPESPKTYIPVPKYVFIPIALIMLAIIMQGMLRDGVTNWLPSFLLESFGVPEENAIIASVIPAVFSIISFFVFDLLHRKLFRNEVTCAGIIFVGSTVCAFALFLINSFFPLQIPALLLAALIIGSMHGINLMLITVVPKGFVKSGKVSTYSGLLNA